VLERFQREIRAAAQLHHPNIVTAFAATRIGESIVFSMQYVDGHDLAKLVEKGVPLPVAHACNFVYQAALGLQHAFEHGMVHRDIKPSNLMLAKDGNKPVIKILDFGLAKVTSEGGIEGGLTHEGQMLGTPHYVAPEQTVNAQKADIRADIYSLGCTLYCLLAGHPPFDAPNLYELLQAHHSMDAKPLNFVRPEVPAELAAVVAKMLAKEPERRFQSPGEVAQTLVPFFKKGALVPGAAKLDVSRSDEKIAGHEPRSAKPMPSQPGASTSVRKSGSRKSSDAESPEAPWQSLVELDRSAPEADAEVVAPSGRPLWLRWPVVGGAALIGILAMGIFVIATNTGQIKNTIDETKPAQAGEALNENKEAAVGRAPNENAAPAGQDANKNAAPANPGDPSPLSKAILSVLETPLRMEFPTETPLEDVLKYIQESTKGFFKKGIPIYVASIGLTEAESNLQSTVKIDLEGVPLKTSLRKVLEQRGLAYVVHDGVLFITSAQSIAEEEKEPTEARVSPSDTSPKTKEIVSRLAKPVPMSFPGETPLEDILTYIKKETKDSNGAGIPIYVDPLGLTDSDRTMQSTVAIDLEEVPLKTTLRLLLHQTGLAYCVKDGVLTISSPDRIDVELNGKKKEVSEEANQLK
jgi:serine/threonine protein kinase